MLTHSSRQLAPWLIYNVSRNRNVESDWKKFRDMVPRLRERFLVERNAHIARLLTDSKKSETERFWEAEEEARKVARTLRDCLDGHSRSKMTYFLYAMRAAGMLRKEDLVDFSQELQMQIFDERFEKKG